MKRLSVVGDEHIVGRFEIKIGARKAANKRGENSWKKSKEKRTQSNSDQRNLKGGNFFLGFKKPHDNEGCHTQNYCSPVAKQERPFEIPLIVHFIDHAASDKPALF